MKSVYVCNFTEFAVKFKLSFISTVFSSVVIIHAIYTTRTDDKEHVNLFKVYCNKTYSNESLFYNFHIPCCL
jgi:hypothetical protein